MSLADGESASRQWIDALVEGFAVPDVTETGVTGESFPADVLREIFSNYDGVTDFRRYLANIDGRVAGGGGLYTGHGVGILCGAATLASFRRQGVQAALLRRRLEDAAGGGVRPGGGHHRTRVEVPAERAAAGIRPALCPRGAGARGVAREAYRRRAFRNSSPSRRPRSYADWIPSGLV